MHGISKQQFLSPGDYSWHLHSKCHKKYKVTLLLFMALAMQVPRMVCVCFFFPLHDGFQLSSMNLTPSLLTTNPMDLASCGMTDFSVNLQRSWTYLRPSSQATITQANCTGKNWLQYLKCQTKYSNRHSRLWNQVFSMFWTKSETTMYLFLGEFNCNSPYHISFP